MIIFGGLCKVERGEPYSVPLGDPGRVNFYESSFSRTLTNYWTYTSPEAFIVLYSLYLTY